MAELDALRTSGEADLVSGTQQLQQKLGQLEDSNDGLSQRIRFLERQIIKMREDANRHAFWELGACPLLFFIPSFLPSLENLRISLG